MALDGASLANGFSLSTPASPANLLTNGAGSATPACNNTNYTVTVTATQQNANNSPLPVPFILAGAAAPVSSAGRATGRRAGMLALELAGNLP